MAGELIIAAAVSCAALLPAAVMAHRAATAAPRPTVDPGECSGDDCRECSILFGHPSQARVRREIAARLPHQTRQGGAL
ncbi:hypothetical protein [Streptomyces sp. SAI-127]|uniref:hypothetical protein n=1 Tax=Streptomyces sp. SAI-127 TaxID=2940543 RepID=UPI0024750DE6|nr:hypothetical protein [Streptomyces sp. SAI-127]MDH6489573.1 hypothetical protein [Streptomyces sp. SAI-127]